MTITMKSFNNLSQISKSSTNSLVLNPGIDKYLSNMNTDHVSSEYVFKKISNKMEDLRLQEQNLEQDIAEASMSEFDIVKDDRKQVRDVKKYYLFYISNNSQREVSKKTFTKVKGKICVVSNTYTKILGVDGEKKKYNKLLKMFPNSNILTGLKSILTGLGVLGSVKSQLDNPKFKMLALNFGSLIISAYNAMENGMNLPLLLSIMLEMYKTWEGYNSWQCNSIDACAMATISMFMPKNLFEVFKRVNMFSNVKFLDDPSNFYDLIYTVFDYLKKLIEYMGIAEITRFLQPLLDYVSNKITYIKLKRLSLGAEQLFKDPKKAMSSTFRIQFYKDFAEVTDNIGISEWAKRSATIRAYLDSVMRCNKMLRSYDNACRIEPNCFVFEGGPGLFKSVYMNAVVEATRESCYHHAIHCKQDGKDWYDAYNYEKIFCMDDVGAQGVSQWRTIVSMVSPVKLPLDCADVALKDTKFFSSENIVVSTNNFSRLQGLTKDDGISDIQALWRRGYVFDFQCKRFGSMLSGNILFKHYDMNFNAFKNGFTDSFMKECKDRGIFIPFNCVMDLSDPLQKVKCIAWMVDIIRCFMVVKERERELNVVDPDLVEKFTCFKMSANGSLRDLDVEQECANADLLDTMFDWGSSSESHYSEVEEVLSVDSEFEEDVNEWSMPSIDSIDPVEDMQVEAISMLQSITDLFTIDSKYYFVIIALIVLFITVCSWKFFKRRSMKIERFYPNTQLHPSLRVVNDHIYEVDFMIQRDTGNVRNTNYGLCSGHSIVTVYHPFAQYAGKVSCTIFKNKEINCVLVDKLDYDIVYFNQQEDVCVLQCRKTIASPFKNLSKHFKCGGYEREFLAKDAFLLSLNKAIKLDTLKIKQSMGISYSNRYMQNTVLDAYSYQGFEGAGTCGSLIMDAFNGVLGMHVAGSVIQNAGASILWSLSVRSNIQAVLVNDDKFILQEAISQVEIPNFSGVKLDVKVNLSSPKNNAIKPTQLFGVFQNYKEPCDLMKYGRHTVKDVAKKSFKPLKDVPRGEVEFAKKVFDSLLPEFTDLIEKEVVLGNEWIAGLNRQSSNGYNCDKDKDVYINFENGCYTERFKEELKCLKQDINNGDLHLQDLLWAETLKEETRVFSKCGEPRSFRISRLHIQVLTKELCGQLAQEIVKTGKFTGIAIGSNPIKDWPFYYSSLQECDNRFWAGDIKFFDGGMLSQLQQALNLSVFDKYKGNNLVILQFILDSLSYCLLGVNDDVYLTNHSMPSGSFLTALFNSLINKGYMAMWYYRNVDNACVSGFFQDIFGLVLGDDMVVAVRNPKLVQLNSISMRDFFQTIGLDYTTADKKLVTEPYDDLKSITFLKRSFEFHPGLGQIVCPLDLSTILSSIQWYNSKQEYEDVLKDKIHCFQREAYLHYYLFSSLVDKLEQGCKDRGIVFVRLPVSYLKNLYLTESNACKLLSYSNMKYL